VVLECVDGDGINMSAATANARLHAAAPSVAYRVIVDYVYEASMKNVAMLKSSKSTNFKVHDKRRH
jgi:hypothetical protein